MATTHTLTGNVYDLTGAPLGTSGVRVSVVTNLPQGAALIDRTRNDVHLGGHPALIDSTGAFSAELVATDATDLNVAANTLQYEVRVEYVNPGSRVRSLWTSGWFSLTADANLADLSTDVEPLAVQSASAYALEAKTYRDEAATISGLTGEDAAVAFLVEDSGSATAGALSATYATRPDNGAPAVGQGELVLNIKDYGATGDGTTDDTTAIQSCIDAAYTAKAEVFVPPGTYKITTALLLPPALRIRGAGVVNDVYSSLGKSSRIDSYGPEAFKVGTGQGTPTAYLSMSDLYVSNQVTPQTGTAFVRDTILRGARLERVTVDNFGTIFDAPTGQNCMNFVSLIRGCHFMGIWDAFNSGAIVDTTIDGNYINGRPLTNPTCFDVNGWSQVTITNNYVDYFKYMFKLSGSHSTITVTGNRFDVAFRAIWSSTAPRSIDRCTFTANTFRYMRAADLAKFVNPDTDMSTGSWIAVEVNGAVGSTFVGNVFDRVDTAFKFRSYPHLDLKVKGNTYQTVTTQVDWSVTKSGTAGDLTGIDIDPLHDVRVAVLPSAALSGGSCVTFDKQRLNYSGVQVYNDNGTWKKYDGTTAV